MFQIRLILIVACLSFILLIVPTEGNNTSNPVQLDGDLVDLAKDYSFIYARLLLEGLEYSHGGYLCHDGLTRLKEDVRNNQLNAKKMVDYSGRVPSQSNISFVDFGYYRQCIALPTSSYCLVTGTLPSNLITINDRTWHDKNVTIDYLADLNHHLNVTRKASLFLGLCLPIQCDGQDVANLATALLSGTNLTISLDRCEKHDDMPIKLTRYDAIALTWLGLVLMSHLIGPFTSQKKPLSAFNLKQSWTSFRSHTPRNPEDQVTCIYGFKTLCMLALIIGNLQYLAIIPSKFDSPEPSDTNYPLIGFPINSYIHLVDTFFLISGFLALRSAYSRLRSIKPKKVVFIRGARHSALITATIALYFACFNRWVKSYLAGPLWETFYGARGLVQSCQDSWWSEMLLVDLWRFRYNHCTLSSWYLAIDLVCFSSSIYFVIPWLEMRLIAIILMVLSFGSGLLASGFALYKIAYPPTLSSNELFTPGYFDFVNVFLSKPWIHGASYMMGVLTAFYMRQPRPGLSKLKQRLITVVTIGFLVSVHFLEVSWTETPKTGSQRTWSIVYGIGIRFIWSASFSWLIYLIHSQSTFTWLNRFLSHPVFRSLSKLNLSLLLTNFLVIRLRNSIQEFPVNLNPVDWLVYHIIPNLILIYGLAFILTLAIEIPSIRAAKKIAGIPEKGGTGRILTRPQIYSDIKVVSNTLGSDYQSKNQTKNGTSLAPSDGVHSVKF